MKIKDIRPCANDATKIVISFKNEVGDWKLRRRVQFVASECLERKEYHLLKQLLHKIRLNSDEINEEDHPDYDDELVFDTERVIVSVDELNELIGYLTSMVNGGIEGIFDMVIDYSIIDTYQDYEHPKEEESHEEDD